MANSKIPEIIGLQFADLKAALDELGVAADRQLFQALSDQYNAPERHYHGQSHIVACLKQFKQYQHLASHPGEIKTAIWFHDAIYDTRKNDNEEQSAAWAERYLSEQGAESSVVERVVEMIITTKSHRPGNDDAALMVDVDLGILGASAATFERYDQAIRREYHWVPEAQYCVARAEVLQSFLAREMIYHTAELRNAFEAQARKNLLRKISELQH